MESSNQCRSASASYPHPYKDVGQRRTLEKGPKDRGKVPRLRSDEEQEMRDASDGRFGKKAKNDEKVSGRASGLTYAGLTRLLRGRSSALDVIIGNQV